jgi:fumarate hydratase class II
MQSHDRDVPDPSGPAGSTRADRDAMGEVQVPRDALYGAETARAAAWAFTAQRLPAAVVHALGLVKAGAARAHRSAGRLPADVADAIERAAREVADGRHDGEFVVDLFQTGSGTSSHMNANEVIANRASELLGDARGSGRVHAHDHVNLGQSSNDVIPSAIRIAAVLLGERRLLPALARLAADLHALADRHWHDVRNGRTHLMTAMPVRFGQQFRAAAQLVEAGAQRIAGSLDACRALPLGGTAVGTGVNCPPGFAAALCTELSGLTGTQLRETTQHLPAQQGLGALAWLSADVRAFAATAYKLTNDLRWQASDALHEIELPALQPGSSIMVGKVNPVVCEAALMAFAQVLGNDAVVAFAETQGQFELNTMLPLAAHNVIGALELVAGAATALSAHVLAGLRVRPESATRVAGNPILATALVREIGHDRAAALARAAVAQGVPVLEVARARGLLPVPRLQELLDPARLCGDSGQRREAD